MRNVVIIVLILIFLVACSEPETNYQATIVSQQGTMIAMMQTTTPTRTPTMNIWNTPIPQTDDMTLDAISTLVAVESDESDQSMNPSTSNPYNQDIFQSMGRLVELESTAYVDTRKKLHIQNRMAIQDAKLQSTVIKQNRTIITAIAQLTTQQANLQSTAISQNSKVIAQIDNLIQQNTTIINYHATAVSQSYVAISQETSQHATVVSLSRTAISLDKKQNDALDYQIQLLLRICQNTAQNSTDYYKCSR
jgi:hypothetical protein